MMMTNMTPFYPSTYGSAPFPNLINHFVSIRPPTFSYYNPNPTPVKKALPTPPPPPSKTTPPKAPSFKFYDLETSKRSDLIRFIFAFAGVPIKDKRLKGEEWEKLKEGEFSFEQLPILRINHQLKVQHLDPILHYLAREFHLYGTGQHDHVIVDIILESLRPFHEHLVGHHSDETIRQWLTTQGPTHLAQLEKLHHAFDRHPPFYLGSHVSIADLVVYFILQSLIKVQPDLLQSYPHLKQAHRRLEKHPQMAPYLRSKPQVQQKAIEKEKPRRETTPPTSAKPPHRHRSTSKQHRHHHHRSSRHQSKEPTPSVRSKRESKSPSVARKEKIPTPPPPEAPIPVSTELKTA